MANPTLLLVRFKQRDQLMPALSNLEKIPNPPGWCTLDGPYDLAVCVGNNGSGELGDELTRNQLAGASVETLTFLDQTPCDVELNSEKSQILVCVEAEPESRSTVHDAFATKESYLWGSRSEGAYSVVAMFESESFDRLDELVDKEIAQMPGVLRFRLNRVINLDRM